MISVIMSAYSESEQYLKMSIESILHQTYRNIEFIIVIDNPDNKMLIQFIESYAKKDSRIIAIKNKKNIGLTASLNEALRYVHGEYIARMDADDIADKNRIIEQIEYIKKHKLDLVGCELRRISEEGNIVDRRSNYSFNCKTVARLLRYDNCVAHPSWLAKKEVYDVLGGYREIKACEDYDFLLRAIKQGFKIGIADSILLSYRVNTKGISRNNALRQMLSALYLQKNYSNIEKVSQEEVDKYLNSRVTTEKSERYEEAYSRLCNYIADVKDGKYFSLFKILFLIFKSEYITINLYKMICIRWVKRGEGKCCD